MLARLGRISPAHQRLLIVAACAVLFCVWLTWMPLTEIDEMRFSEATREMVTSHHYIIPTFNSEPRYQKPILYYWIQSASIRLFGTHEAAARFPSAVIAILLILLVHAFLLRWLPARAAKDDPVAQASARGAALLGAFALATMPLLAIWARGATTDVTLTFFTSAAILAMMQAELTRVQTPAAPQRARRWYLLAAIALALAFLTKGPVGVIIPGLTWLGYHAYQRNLIAELRRVPWPAVVGLFVLVAAPWYIATYYVDGPAFLKHFFMTENLQRYTSVMEGHGTDNRLQGLLLYLPMALVLAFPFSIFLLHEGFSSFAGNARLRADDILVRLRRFAWSWLAVVIGLFSLSRTQLPSYIQSIVAAVAILFALHVLGRLTAGAPTDARPPRVHGVTQAFEVLLLVLIGGALAGYLSYAMLTNHITMVGWVPPSPIPHHAALPAAIALGTAGGLFMLGVLLWGVLRRGELFIGWTMAAWALVLGVLLLIVGPIAVRSNYQEMAKTGVALRDVPADIPVFAYFPSAPETLVYYARRRIELCSLGDENFCTRLLDKLSAGKGAVVVTDQAGITRLNGLTEQAVLLQQRGNIYIVQVTEVPKKQIVK